jgi:hypothetical protein
MIKKSLVTICLFLFSVASFAQNNDVEMADTMRSNGKIYVVFAVALVILIGIFIYLFRMDRKLTKL